MATQRQPAVRQAHPTTLPSLRGLSSAKSSRKNSPAIAEGGTTPQAGVENDPKESQREPERQAVFQRRSNQALKLPNGYLKVAVLIMRWDESVDDFKGHTGEVSRATNAESLDKSLPISTDQSTQRNLRGKIWLRMQSSFDH